MQTQNQKDQTELYPLDQKNLKPTGYADAENTEEDQKLDQSIRLAKIMSEKRKVSEDIISFRQQNASNSRIHSSALVLSPTFGSEKKNINLLTTHQFKELQNGFQGNITQKKMEAPTNLQELSNHQQNMNFQLKVKHNDKANQNQGNMESDHVDQPQRIVNAVNKNESWVSKKKKIIAKDDSFKIAIPKNPDLKYENQQRSPLLKKDLSKVPTDYKKELTNFERHSREAQNQTQQRKRKMSATPTRGQPKKTDLIAEEEENVDWELAQSLLTLKLKTRQEKQTTNRDIRSQRFKDSHLSKKKSMLQYFLQGNDVLSDEALHAEIPVMAKSDKDEECDSENKTVSLYDSDLQEIGLKMNMNISLNAMDDIVQSAIQMAEHDTKYNGENINQQNEEYESLVLGTSIWSTDVQKETAKQFMQTYQQKINSEHQQKSEQRKNDSDDDFELLQQKIHEETSNTHNSQIGNEKVKPMRQISSSNIIQNNMLNPQMNPYQNYIQPGPDLSQQMDCFIDPSQNSLFVQNYQQPPAQNEFIPQHQGIITGVNQEYNYFNIQQQNNLKRSFSSNNQQPSGISVHSGGHLHIQTGAHQQAYDPDYQNQRDGLELPDNASSNYTNHPFSQYDQHPNWYDQEQKVDQQQFNNHHNRAHLFINRQINKYMMNPIYRSKQTISSLQMNRFAAVPWRGSNNNQSHNFNTIQQDILNPGVYRNDEEMKMQQQKEMGPNINAQPWVHKNSIHDYNNYTSQQLATIQEYPKRKVTSEIKEDNKEKREGLITNVDAKPFYPTANYSNQKINEKQNILTGAAKSRPKIASAIHVPIILPIIQSKGKQPQNKNQGPFIGDKEKERKTERQSQSNPYDVFDDQILSKKIELDKKMQVTTQKLQSKLNKAVEINEEIQDVSEDEEADITFECLSKDDNGVVDRSIDRPDSSLNHSISLKDVKNQNYADNQNSMSNFRPRKNSEAGLPNQKIDNKIKRRSDKAQNFKKLLDQLKELQVEMFNQNELQTAHVSSSISPKRSIDLMQKDDQIVNIVNAAGQTKMHPFRQDPKQYMDKVISLISIINELDELTNVKELEEKIQTLKLNLKQARSERDEIVIQFQKLKNEYDNKCKEIEDKELENRNIQNQLEANLNELTDQIQDHNKHSFDLSQKLQQLSQDNQDMLIRNSQAQDQISIYHGQIQSLQSQIDQLQNNAMIQHNQLQSNNNQIESINQSNYQLQQQNNHLQMQNQKLLTELENMELQNKSTKKDDSENDDEFTIPIEEQLENANQQIKDLQEYIKQKSLEDIKNNQIRQENFQKNEKAHLEKYNNLKRQKDQMEREKDSIIMHLKDFIKNHNESILVGSIGSSMIGGFGRAPMIPHSGLEQMQMMADEHSTIDGKSFESYSINDKTENEDIIRSIMQNYSCEKCEQKDRQIKINEERIEDYINYIKKQRAAQTNQKAESQIQEQSKVQENTFISSPNTSNGQLQASNKILLNNFVRQLKEYLDNLEDSSDSIEKMRQKLDEIAESQKITLFDEEEQPDPEIITTELIQDILSSSLDLVNELLKNQVVQVVEKKVFKTVEFGVTLAQLKEMQAVGRTERKACHHIIVEIEKLMYEMNSIIQSAEGPDQQNGKEVFSKILETYLLLPHRLKPIFDHSKKFETVLLKTLKSQQEQLAKE